jgi:hypothetical protein
MLGRYALVGVQRCPCVGGHVVVRYRPEVGHFTLPCRHSVTTPHLLHAQRRVQAVCGCLLCPCPVHHPHVPCGTCRGVCGPGSG